MPGLQNSLFRASCLCWLAFTITLSFFSALLLFGQSSPILSLHNCFLIPQKIMELHLPLLKYIFIFPDFHCSNQACWPMDREDAKEHYMGVLPVHCFPAHLAVPSDLVFLLLHVPATVTFCQPALLQGIRRSWQSHVTASVTSSLQIHLS